MIVRSNYITRRGLLTGILVELWGLQGQGLHCPDPALLRLCCFGAVVDRVGPVTPILWSCRDSLQTPPGSLEARAVPHLSTRGIPGSFLRPGPEGGPPVLLLGVRHVARTQRTDLVLDSMYDTARCGERGGWFLQQGVHSSLGLEVGAILRVEHGVPQPGHEPLKSETTVRRSDPPEAAQHSAWQVSGVCTLPATLYLRDVDIASSTVVQNVKKSPQTMQESFG